MGPELLAALLAVVAVPEARAVWLGRLDPKQLLGPWYVLAVASREKGFVVEKATRNVHGVVVTLTPDNNLRVLSSRDGLKGCSLATVELLRQSSRWVFENPSLGVLEYRVLGTNFRDYAIVFTQMESGDEPFNTVELYSRTHQASHEAVRLFSKWSANLGYLAQEQATLQKDLTCAHRILQVSCLPGHHLVSLQESGGALRAALVPDGQEPLLVPAVWAEAPHQGSPGSFSFSVTALVPRAAAPAAWQLIWPGVTLLPRPPGPTASQGLALGIAIK
ncbi:epididymal-specific lipocalin-6 [Tamandua tetradactyla]|uniref:epididymal-specific lipocalin-6 n=1 Tax=Tamandua tetradactyla TaxID=48850 RepID=UPI004053FC96